MKVLISNGEDWISGFQREQLLKKMIVHAERVEDLWDVKNEIRMNLFENGRVEVRTGTIKQTAREIPTKVIRSRNKTDQTRKQNSPVALPQRVRRRRRHKYK